MSEVKINLETVRKLRKEKEIHVSSIISALGIKSTGTYYKKELGQLSFSLEEAKILSELFQTNIENLFFAS